MQRRLSVTVIIFFSAFMLNVSAMAFQQRYDRKEDEQENDPFVIEMTDMQVFKFLKNTYFFDLPLKKTIIKPEACFFNEDPGFGNTYTFSLNYYTTFQLKFVLIDYIGFYQRTIPEKTYFLKV